MHPFTQFVNPYLGRKLTQLSMDKSFVRGEGCYLYDADGGRYLDLISSYGALPFGFNPPEIWAAITAVRDSGEPSFVQPSALNAAGELAGRLVAVAPPGLGNVTFANSGAEAVEAALKMCRAATGRRRILAASNSFHGKTLGALSATGRESYQRSFGAPVEGFDFVPYGDVAALEEVLSERGEQYAALILEPVQGEGGIVVPPPGYLAAARRLCDTYGILFVLDEIQTGLGRTGTLFACQAGAITPEDVVPDVMLLAKALGGGIMPIGACLANDRSYNEEFALKHSSTFAGNTLACRAGIAVLDLLEKDDRYLVREAARKGAALKEGLVELQRRYPEVVCSIRGHGLMLGIEFSVNRDTFRGSLLGVMAEQELLTPVISSYLLNIEHLRVAPTLNGNTVIRIEPPLVITDDQCVQALDGIGRMLAVLAERNTARFLRYLVGIPEGNVVSMPRRRDPAPRPRPSADPAEGRFAFLVHPVDIRNYAEFDDSLAAFNDVELEALAGRWNDMVEPFVVSEARITSDTGRVAYGEFIAIPRTADEMLSLPRPQMLGELRAALDLARKRGARIAGLGAYTSVVSRGGLDLLKDGIPLTTGNSYTVVAAVDAVTSALARLGIPPRAATAAVVGASGSIGRATSILLAEDVSRLLLIGNPQRPEQSRRRLLKVAGDIYRHLAQQLHGGRRFGAGTAGAELAARGGVPEPDAPAEEFVRLAEALAADGGPVVITTDIDGLLPLADVVVTATSSTSSLVTPRNVKSGAAVCDLSRPPNVSREVRDARPDVLVIDGGVIAVPGLPSLGWNFGFEQGLAYACMAETMILALEHHYEHTSIGADLPLDMVLRLRQMAAVHGFRLANLRSFDRPLDEGEWERIARVRNAASGHPAM